MKTINNKKIFRDNKNNICYLNDNIFDIIKQRISANNMGVTVIVPHVCNNVNAYGAGFALDVANQYPAAKANFHLLGNKSKLGHVQFITVDENPNYKHKIIIGNMIAQNGLKNHNNHRPLNYGALSDCMSKIKMYISHLSQLLDNSSVEIHAPRFGSGLAGGNWNFIEQLIEDIWTNIPVYIYQPKQK